MTTLFFVTSCCMTPFFRDGTLVVVGCAVCLSEAASDNIENQVVCCFVVIALSLSTKYRHRTVRAAHTH